MENNEKTTDESRVDTTEAAQTASEAEENSETGAKALGREIALGLREIITEEIDRRLATKSEAPAALEEDDTALYQALMSDPRFLRLLSERLARRDTAARMPNVRRRGATVLPASAPSAPKNLDDAKAAARKYFRID